MSKVVEAKISCPKCPSSDAYHEYDDGHGYCFSCKYFKPGKEVFNLSDFTYEFLPRRGITAETHKFYNIKTKVDAEGKPIAVGYPYPNGSIHVRKLDAKEFYWDKSNDIIPVPGLFGRDRFAAGSATSVTITEGEDDAQSLKQLLGLPCVSIRSSGCAVADCTADWEWLNSFERIYLAFDNDGPGREATGQVARLFDYNKIYHVKFDTRKDANEFLQVGEDKQLKTIWENSKRYLPDNIISTFDEFRKILSQPKKVGIPYPFKTLTEMTYGIRTGETVLLTAQEGVGKTELMHAIEHAILKGTDDNVASIFIEEDPQRHLEALVGVELRKPVHLPDCSSPTDEQISAIESLVRTDGRLHIYDHFGSDDPKALLDGIRFLVSARLCRYVLFDHITMAISGLPETEERRALDVLSTRLQMMVKELDFALLLVSHVNDYGQTRGSRYIGKIANTRIDITRDLMNKDEMVKNTTSLFVSKNRFGMRTGQAGKLLFVPSEYSFKEVETGFGGQDVGSTFS